MRHRYGGNPLGRNPGHRKALLRNLATSLFKHEQIETTDAKAKALRPVAEKLITLAKRGDLHARRQALSYINEKSVVHRLFDEVKDRYLDRQGGYIRIVKKGCRKGDGASVSIVQLLPSDEKKKSRGKKAGKPKPSGKARIKQKTAGTAESAESDSARQEDKADGAVEEATDKENG
ncbi:MAG: 50S ribosomal protein L17 [Deltaproteobacteria bacterium]|nr:MAG: 50S ribosomal protein L17 [Deltaproteobacteria bacterium]